MMEMAKASAPPEDHSGHGKRKPRKGSNAGGKSAWMRGFFDRPSMPLWKAVKSDLMRRGAPENA